MINCVYDAILMISFLCCSYNAFDLQCFCSYGAMVLLAIPSTKRLLLGNNGAFGNPTMLLTYNAFAPREQW